MKLHDKSTKSVLVLVLVSLLTVSLVVGVGVSAAVGMPIRETNYGTTSTSTAKPVVFNCKNRLAQTIWKAGFRGTNVREAWAISMRESGGDERQITNGSDFGLFQFNRPSWGNSSWWVTSKMLTGSYNARIAYKMSKGGRDWRHWGLTGTGQTDPAMYDMWSQWQIDNWITKPYRKYYSQFPCKTALARTMTAGVGKRGAQVPLDFGYGTRIKAVPVRHRDLYRGTPAQAKAEAKYLSKKYGWNTGEQWQCLVQLWNKESGWRWNSDNGDNGRTWGVPQSYPGTKMRTAGPDWHTNVSTQIKWGLKYIKSSYGSVCRAWSRWQDRAGSGSYGWY